MGGALRLDALRAGMQALTRRRSVFKRVKGAREGPAGRSAVLVGFCAFGKRYRPAQVVAVVLVTCGTVATLLADAREKQRRGKGGADGGCCGDNGALAREPPGRAPRRFLGLRDLAVRQGLVRLHHALVDHGTLGG